MRHAPTTPRTVIVQTMPRRSLFRDAAAIAGGVTVGTAAGHVVGAGITSLFGGGGSRASYQEAERALPRGYDWQRPPSGPCAYEINQFLQCASGAADISDCQGYADQIKGCKRHYGID